MYTRRLRPTNSRSNERTNCQTTARSTAYKNLHTQVHTCLISTNLQCELYINPPINPMSRPHTNTNTTLETTTPSTSLVAYSSQVIYKSTLKVQASSHQDPSLAQHRAWYPRPFPHQTRISLPGSPDLLKLQCGNIFQILDPRSWIKNCRSAIPDHYIYQGQGARDERYRR